MSFRVLYQPEAASDLERAINWSFRVYPDSAHRWCKELLNAIESLSSDPCRHPLAREDHHFEEEIRQLLFGKGKAVYSVLFTVIGNDVRILHIRFPRQPLLE